MLLQALLLLSLATGTGEGVYNGRANQLEVKPPRLTEDATIDGDLADGVWARAAILTGFSQYRPVDGLPAADSTEVLVWYSSHAMYIGIRAFEPHGTVNATLADRDKIFGDDNIQILLDTYDDKRRALLFAVNPFGVQGDGVRTESEQSGSFFSAEAREGGATDLSPDFVFQSKGRVTDYGYEVEIRIPFKSIRYQSTDPQRWGINIVREVQHAGQQQTWAPVRRGQTSFLAQSGGLSGLTDLRRGIVVDLNPVATRRLDGAPEARGWGYSDDGFELGLNARVGLSANLTLNGTVNPDFSQVESDVAQVQFDPRQALFFPEKRPFFLEGREQFAVPNGIIYTRSIVEPVGAAKLTGKIAGTDVAFLSAVDDQALSRSRDDNPVFTILRVRRDIGEQSTLGIAYTDRIEGDDFNRVAAVDGRLVLDGRHTLSFQAAGSFNRAAGESFSAPLWQLGVQRSGREFGWSANFTGIHDDFVARSGFIGRRGVVYGNTSIRRSFFYKEGSRLEGFSTAVSLPNTWVYERFASGEARPDELKVHLNNTLTFRGGWTAGFSLLVENWLLPQDLYRGFHIERRSAAGVDTVPFVGRPSINNYDVVLSFGTPAFPKFSAGGFVLFGRDENFPEWAPGYINWTELTAEWRPTEKIRVGSRYNETRVLRQSDRSLVQLTSIPRVKVEYQISRPIFVRLVGQYVAFKQDSLRDDGRTGDPLLVPNRTRGELERTQAVRFNDLRLDWLFSYQPNPGTVIFAGYGSSLEEGRAFRFSDLRRAQDGFFLKVSYLFRR